MTPGPAIALVSGTIAVILSFIGMKPDHLALANQHITEGEKVVQRQRQIVAWMRASGLDSTRAESTLLSFCRLLDGFYALRRRMSQR